jgi:hypothetical protein
MSVNAVGPLLAMEVYQKLMIPERLARKVVYQSEWVNLYVDKVQFPSGRIIEHHHLLDFEYPAVTVIGNCRQVE